MAGLLPESPVDIQGVNPAGCRRGILSHLLGRNIQQISQCADGIGQAVRLVGRSAERMRGQKWGVGLHQKLAGRDESGGLPQGV